jgi:hypothetical protein
MKVQKQFFPFVLLVSTLFFFGCEVVPEDIESGGREPKEWVDVTNLFQASGTWKMAFEREYSNTPVIMSQVEYILDMYINLTTLRIVVTFAGDDVANSWDEIKTNESAAGGNIVFNDTDHSETMTADISLDDFEIKIRGDKLKMRLRGNEPAPEIEMTRTSDDWSSFVVWTEVIGVWKGEYTENVPIEIPEPSGNPILSEIAIHYEIKLEVTVDGAAAVTPTVVFSGVYISYLWDSIREDYADVEKYEVDDANHTVSIITEEPAPDEFEIHAGGKKLRAQVDELAIILFKVEPAVPS